MADRTPAETISAAAALLREWAVQIRRLMAATPGPPYPTAAAFLEALGRQFPVSTALGDHIASWTPDMADLHADLLETAAKLAKAHPQDRGFTGLPDYRYCTTCDDEQTECIAITDKALAIAQTLLGEEVGGL